MLLIGGGCRGRALAAALTAEGHAVRAVTRTEEGRAAIEATGAECWIGDPDRIGTLRYALESVTIVVWALGTASGDAEKVGALHGSRLTMLLERTVDTTARGFVYEASGTVPAGALERGAAEVRRMCELNEVPYVLLQADPADSQAWARRRARRDRPPARARPRLTVISGPHAAEIHRQSPADARRPRRSPSMRAVAPQTRSWPTTYVSVMKVMAAADDLAPGEPGAQVGDGQLEHPLDLLGRRRPGVAGLDHPDERVDGEARGDRRRGRQGADDLDRVGGQPDLLEGLAQRGGLQVGVAVVGPAARKRHLAGVPAQVVVAARQDDGQLAAGVDEEGDEHRGVGAAVNVERSRHVRVQEDPASGWRASSVREAATGSPGHRSRSAASDALDTLLEHDLAVEGAMHGALRGDHLQALDLIVVERVGEAHDQLEAVGAPRSAGW